MNRRFKGRLLQQSICHPPCSYNFRTEIRGRQQTRQVFTDDIMTPHLDLDGMWLANKRVLGSPDVMTSKGEKMAGSTTTRLRSLEAQEQSEGVVARMIEEQKLLDVQRGLRYSGWREG